MPDFIPLPPPIKGIDAVNAAVLIESPWCQTLANFNNTNSRINLRSGHELFASTDAGSSVVALRTASYDSETPKLFRSYIQGGTITWEDITSGTPSSVHTVGSASDTEMEYLYFNNYLFFFGDVTLLPSASGPQYYNGSAWGAAGYTWPSGFKPWGGCVFKSRAYFIDKGTAAFGYSNIDAIAGAVTRVDLASQVQSSARLYAIASISLGENVDQQNVMAFVFSNGEVLIYAGSYPNSANWARIARWKMGSRPLYYNSTVDAEGDTFILTDSGPLSIRNMFRNGYATEERRGIGYKIRNRWSQIVKDLRADSAAHIKKIRGAYDEENDRLCIAFPRYVSSFSVVDSSSQMQLFFDFVLEAWYEYNVQTLGTGEVFQDIAYHNRNLYFLHYRTAGTTDNVLSYKCEGKSNFQDDVYTGASEQNFGFTLISAPTPIDKFRPNRFSAIELLMKSDMFNDLKVEWRDRIDGTFDTTPQKTTGDSSYIDNYFFNTGIEGSLVQYILFGTTAIDGDSASIGIQLYGLNLIKEPSRGVIR